MFKLAASLWLMTRCVAPAQTAAETWVQRHDTQVGANDTAMKMAIDPSGNVIVAGYTDDGINGRTFLVLKYLGAGVPLWTNLYGGGYAGDAAYGLAVDGNGRVFVTGYSWNAFAEDYATVAYSSTGVPLWTNRYGGSLTSMDVAYALAADSTGNVIVTGSSSAGAGSGYLTIKYSGAGTPLWTNRYDGPGTIPDEARAVAVDGSGNVFVTGKSGLDYADPIVVTVAYSAAGAPIWTNRYGGAGNTGDSAVAVAADGSGNVLVTGTANVAWNVYEYVTIKYSGAGMPLWTNLYAAPGSAYNQAAALAVDALGNVFVTGRADAGGGNYIYATVAYSAGGRSFGAADMGSREPTANPRLWLWMEAAK